MNSFLTFQQCGGKWGHNGCIWSAFATKVLKTHKLWIPNKTHLWVFQANVLNIILSSASGTFLIRSGFIGSIGILSNSFVTLVPHCLPPTPPHPGCKYANTWNSHQIVKRSRAQLSPFSFKPYWFFSCKWVVPLLYCVELPVSTTNITDYIH